MEALIEKKSKFYAYKFKVASKKEVDAILLRIKTEHKKASHVCFAYKISKPEYLEKCDDDGEPSGTAGRPILNVLQKKELDFTLLVVVRYFGGIKLGAGGLVRTYSAAASKAAGAEYDEIKM